LPSPPPSRKAPTILEQLVARAGRHRDQRVRPARDEAGGGGGDRGADDARRPVRPDVELRLLDHDPAAVGHGLAGPERAHDVDALPQARVALGLGRPVQAGDALVERLAAAQRHPQPVRVHERQGGAGLGEDGRVVAPAWGGDRAVGEARGLHRGAQPRPDEAGAALALAPGVEVVGRRGAREPGLLGQPHAGQELPRVELLVRGVVAEGRRHVVPAPGCAATSVAPAQPEREARHTGSRPGPGV
jgi:hypothetical protein